MHPDLKIRRADTTAARALRFMWVALALGVLGAGLQVWRLLDPPSCPTDRTGELIAERSRIRTACYRSGASIELTIGALRDARNVGLALAIRDAGLTSLCGGDAGPLQTAVLNRDTVATVAALRSLQAAWCPECVPEPEPEAPASPVDTQQRLGVWELGP